MNKAEYLTKLLKKGGNEATLYLLELFSELQDELESVKQSLEKNPPEETKIEKIAIKLATKLATLEKGDKGDKGDTPTTDEVKPIIESLLPNDDYYIKTIAPLLTKAVSEIEVIHGKTPTKEEILSLIEEVMPEPKMHSEEEMQSMIEPLLPNKEDLIDEIETDLEEDIPKLGEPIRDALELINEEDKKLKIEAVGYLREELDNLKKIKSSTFGGGGGTSGVYSHLDLYDLSSQTDGVLKTFSVPGMTKPFFMISSDFPTPLFLNNGFTYSSTANTITLTTDNAPSSGSQLGLFYSF